LKSGIVARALRYVLVRGGARRRLGVRLAQPGGDGLGQFGRLDFVEGQARLPLIRRACGVDGRGHDAERPPAVAEAADLDAVEFHLGLLRQAGRTTEQAMQPALAPVGGRGGNGVVEQVLQGGFGLGGVGLHVDQPRLVQHDGDTQVRGAAQFAAQLGCRQAAVGPVFPFGVDLLLTVLIQLGRRRSNSVKASGSTTQRGLPQSAIAVFTARNSPRVIHARTLSGLTW
jgi:hypothetical protein